jgi:imidazolonepropionase-like amidohydrolase
VLAGTDTFDAFVLPGVSLHQELDLLVRAGLTPLEAIQSATRAAAEYRGTSATEGTIASGKRADLVLLDADPLADIANLSRVHAVMIGGRLLSRRDLDPLLVQVRTAAQ